MRLNLTHSSFLRTLKAHFEVPSFHCFQSISPCRRKFAPARRVSALFVSALAILFVCLFTGTAAANAKGAPAQLTSPTPGGVLPGSSVTFQWSTGTDVEEFCLHLNTQPGDPDDPASTRIYASGHLTNTSVTVSSVPTNGSALYAILGSEYDGSWHYVTYSFTEAPPALVPTLGASTASLAFGNDAVNTATAQTVTLSSTGTAAVTVSSASIAGSGFTVSGATFPLTLNPGQTAALSVQFDPTAAGAASGSLTLSSNSSSGSSTVVSLSGTGVPVLTGVSCANGSMTGAGTDSCTVSLNAAAATGGFAVSLASNNSAVTVPASVTVAAGSSSASFTATASAVSTATAVTLTANASGATQSFALQLSASVPTLTYSTVSISFGNVNVNSPVTQSVTLTSTGTASVTVSTATVAGTGFSLSGAALPITLAPKQTATLSVQFDPTAAGAASGSLTLSSNSSTGASTVVSLSGTGVPLLTAVSCVNGSMTGAGTDSCTVSLNVAAATGGFAVSLASSNTAVTVPASVTVAAGSSSASFTATASAVSTATAVTLTATASGATQSFALQLNVGVPTLTVSAASIAFGDVNVNSPATQSVTLTSTGTASVTVSTATVAGTGFSLSGATLPITLAPNQTATLSVEFDPTSAASETGTLTIASNSSTNPTDVVSLSGTGEATAYEVTVTWTAPSGSSNPVTGYNVYRAPSGSTSYQQINPTLLTETTYTDTSVQDGLTYDYIVESVDAEGNDSVPSNMASATIP
jgi:Abnormal spindle-like microcephaly-assoc'd, ASPM-SPD-2-Hydin